MKDERSLGPGAEHVDLPVLYHEVEGVAVVTLNRPRFANAQNDHMTYELDRAFMRAVHNDDIGAILLCAEGKHFSSGHDVGPTRATSPRATLEERISPWYSPKGKPGAEKQYVREQEVYVGMCRRWRQLPKPMVAAVQGGCIAGGLMLAWVSDIIVASNDAFFWDPVIDMGVPGVEYFAHAFEMANRTAREFLMLGERMPAERAYACGMVNRLTAPEELHATAMEIARKLASKPRFGMALTKQALNLVEDLAGKQSAIDATFAMHSLAHAHNKLTNDGALVAPSYKLRSAPAEK